MAERFGFVIEDVLHIEGRGTVFVGDFPVDSSPFGSGERIRIVRDGTTVLTGPATLEVHTLRGRSGLSISDLNADVRVGDVVEAEDRQS